MKPLAIDLFCGLGGWGEGFLSEGYDVVGFDVERHDYGTGGYPGQLVIQDVLTLHGSQFKDAAVIVASPPCQEYSYMAMPWSRAKAKAAWYREDPTRQVALTALFDSCFRIQREACEAAGRWIPLVVENVRGANPWVGTSRWNFGSYHLWGDIPALMPIPRAALKWGDCNGKRFDERPKGSVAAHREGTKVKGFRFDGSGRSFQSESVKVCSTDGGRRTDPGKGARFTSRDCGDEGLKFGGGWWHDSTNNLIRKASSKSPARKAASAQIAKIPFPLASWIARCYKPEIREVLIA